MKVAVFGAAGAIGRAITGELLARGYTVTAVTRTGGPVEGLVVQAVTGDAADPASVARHAAGRTPLSPRSGRTGAPRTRRRAWSARHGG